MKPLFWTLIRKNSRTYTESVGMKRFFSTENSYIVFDSRVRCSLVCLLRIDL